MKQPRARTVILAHGAFPTHAVPLAALRGAERVICCDGAVANLQTAGVEPAWIVGDLDSLAESDAQRYADRLVRVDEQATNDLAKAFGFCLERGWYDLAILGATGLREDHTLGNLAWLCDFAVALYQRRRRGRVVMLTDSGVFTPVLTSTLFRSHAGQPVSIFSMAPGAAVYAEGLRYPLDGIDFSRWWQATLNVALGESFKLTFEGTPLLVFQGYAVPEPVA